LRGLRPWQTPIVIQVVKLRKKATFE